MEQPGRGSAWGERQPLPDQGEQVAAQQRAGRKAAKADAKAVKCCGTEAMAAFEKQQWAAVVAALEEDKERRKYPAPPPPLDRHPQRLTYRYPQPAPPRKGSWDCGPLALRQQHTRRITVRAKHSQARKPAAMSEPAAAPAPAPAPVPKPKASTPKAAPTHPGFTAMIVESITALKERTGSSQPAIKKWIEAKYAKDLPSTWEKILSVQLKRMAQTGALVKVKASFKLGEATKKATTPKKPAAPKAAKPAAAAKAKKAAAGTKKPAAPKKAAAKATPAAAKPEAAAEPKKAPTAAKPKPAAAKPKSPAKAAAAVAKPVTAKPKVAKPKTPKTSQPVKPAGVKKVKAAAPKGKGNAAKAKPTPQPGRWVDQDCNAVLNMQRIGESKWRPLEMCWWPEQTALPAKGKENPELGYKRL
ncbi:hypothetical protein QJQ45_000201 [Haematococcus lacustris]|nr:hypothetical protein QJQ45_000201 [Haematococcus lacustris]